MSFYNKIAERIRALAEEVYNISSEELGYPDFAGSEPGGSYINRQLPDILESDLEDETIWNKKFLGKDWKIIKREIQKSIKNHNRSLKEYIAISKNLNQLIEKGIDQIDNHAAFVNQR